jgi:hypothetical protein
MFVLVAKAKLITFTPYHIPIFYNMFEKFFAVAPRARSVDQYGGTLGVLLFNGRAGALVRLLAVPAEPVLTSIPPADGPHLAQSGHHHHQQQTPLPSLPAELHWIIF